MKPSTNKVIISGGDHCNRLIYSPAITAHTFIIIFSVLFREVYVGMKKLID